MNHYDLSFFDSRKYKVTLALSMAIFFYLFVAFFLPFGVDNYDPNHEYTAAFLLELFYFFIPISLFAYANENWLRPLIFKRATWKRVIFWSLWTLWFLTTIIFITYNILGNWHDFKWSSYLEFLYQVPVILIFPMAGVFFYFQYRSLQDRFEQYELKPPTPYQTEERLLTFKGAGSKDQITLSAASFLYGQAQDNYVELFYLENNREQKFVMRSTLKKLVDTINQEAITRCHRSYMVNLAQVKMVKGTNQDTTLYLAPFDTAVPVSRSYLEDTLGKLKELRG